MARVGAERECVVVSEPAILVVDDDELICNLIRDGLASCGLGCSTCTDPAVGLEIITRRQFTLLIADVTMPKHNGLELLARVRQAQPSCKVVLITGYSRRDVLAQAVMLGAYDYLEKPFDIQELLDTVRRALADRHQVPWLSQRAASAIREATSARQVALDSIRALVRAVEAKDPYTRRHSEQVAYYAVNLAEQLALDPETLEEIRVASLLHDIGKIGVPDRILTKPSRLTDDEFELIRRHPAMGADILSNISMFAGEALLVRHHHERWDGNGYPDRLVGEDIPLGARVIQLADCIDAMLMERTYKQGYSVDLMLHELVRCRGAQFDPQMVSAALEWCQEDPSRLILPGREPLMAMPA